MASFEFLAIILTGIGLIVSVLYYASILQNANKTQKMQLETRQAQLFMPIYAKFYDKEFMKDFVKIMTWEWDDLDDFMKKYGMNNPDAWGTIISWTDYFEGIGVLVKRELIDASFIDDLISGMVITFWEKYGEYIHEYRVLTNYPQFAEFCEYLYYEIKAIAEEEHPEIRSGISHRKEDIIKA